MEKRIAHITDTHLGDATAIDRGANPKKNLKKVLEHIALDKIDEIIVTGDLGNKESLPWLFEKLQDYKPGFKVILGNHDVFKDVVKYYKSTKPVAEEELYYTQEDDVYKYIFMDSSSATISKQQLGWLKEEINTLKKIIVFIHHPILGLSTGMDKVYPLKNRDKVKAILEEAKKPVTVFCGHYHMPDKRNEGKITQYITPSTAFQVSKNSQSIDINVKSFAYRIITLTDIGIKTTLVTNCYDRFIEKTG